MCFRLPTPTPAPIRIRARMRAGARLSGRLGWWTLGVYTTYAGIGLMIAALGAIGALVFELFIAVRKPESIKVKVAQKVVA